MQNAIDWSDVQVFIAFARQQSMSEAARLLSQDETTISRRIKRLGAALGTALIEARNGRTVLSESGAALVPIVEQMAEAAVAITRNAEKEAAGPSGIVRVTAIRAVLGRLIIPALPQLSERYPSIALHFVGDSRNLNLSRRESDLAIRLAMPVSPEVTTRKLADIAFGVYALRGLQHRDAPWLTYTEDMGNLPEAQWVERHRGNRTVAAAANTVELLTSATLAGVGIAVLPCFVGDSEPSLLRIEPEPVVVREAWLAVHREDRRRSRIRATMDFVAEIFKAKSNLLAGRKPQSSNRDGSANSAR